MHQDVPYFEHEAHSMIAAVVHFDEATIEKGCIRVVPGSWKRGRMDHIGEGGHHLEVEEFPVEQATPCEAEPGDVLFFSYLCIRKCSHPFASSFRSLKGAAADGSMPNRHPTDSRTSVLIQLRDPADRSLKPGANNVDLFHNSRGQGMMLRGIDPTALSGTAVEGGQGGMAAESARPGGAAHKAESKTGSVWGPDRAAASKL